jgi:hypothetical protein
MSAFSFSLLSRPYLVFLSLLAAPELFPAPVCGNEPSAGAGIAVGEMEVGFRRLGYREFHDERWSSVFSWLADQTGLPVLPRSPAGAFTFVPPWPGKCYALGEFIVVLNRSLRHVGYRMVRRERCLLLLVIE